MAVDAPEKLKPTGDGTVRSPAALPAPEEKHRYVNAMFDAIAPRYDLLNSLLSVRLHHGWRRAAAVVAILAPGETALDICTGTGDLAFELARRVGPAGCVVGGDFSAPMLAVGEKKRLRNPLLSDVVRLMLADAQSLPFPANTFDAVTVGFGIRNVADIRRGLQEMTRVARPGGRVVVLEFQQPPSPFFAAVYRWYSFSLLPRLGGWISGRRAAYDYLPSSVAAFHTREEMTEMMRASGLERVTFQDISFGAVVVYRGVKSPIGKRA
jgi:demethylmenaquinone methyltransferase/2-methoxy-6-polyprenyl-1,4-benzoquinol methylase